MQARPHVVTGLSFCPPHRLGHEGNHGLEVAFTAVMLAAPTLPHRQSGSRKRQSTDTETTTPPKHKLNDLQPPFWPPSTNSVTPTVLWSPWLHNGKGRGRRTLGGVLGRRLGVGSQGGERGRQPCSFRSWTSASSARGAALIHEPACLNPTLQQFSVLDANPRDGWRAPFPTSRPARAPTSDLPWVARRPGWRAP